jgi:uncharacterized protein
VTGKDKTERLLEILRTLERVVVAFSGGVDSSFLAAAARRALGDNAVAATACSATLTPDERERAEKIAAAIGVRHVLLETHEFDSTDFTSNNPERCYHCKKVRFRELAQWAAAEGFPWIVEGSNVDDQSDYRPGERAVVELPMVRSPLREAGLGKAEIRRASREWGLDSWDQPSAACLASRVEYGLALTPERLRQVGEAEAFLRPHVQGQLRARHHGDLVRIEVEPDQMPRLLQPELRDRIVEKMRELGFLYVALDMRGYRMGSLNQSLRKADEA